MAGKIALMGKVVFVGDYNVDIILDGMEKMPAPDREIGCSSFDLAIGASSCIAASAYACLGGSAWLCGLSGDDELGRFMIAGLQSAGVRVDLVRRDPGLKTGVTVNLVQGATRLQVTYPGSMARFSLSDIPNALFDDIRHLHVSGIYQTKALLPDVSALLARAATAGATTSLDCQWDPAERWEGLDAWLPAVDWLFANEAEARSMTGCAKTPQAVRALAARTRCPVVKAGSAGACVIIDADPVTLPGYAVALVDPIGAGDTFDAGFLFAAIEKAMPLAEAARFANAAAGRSCTFRGGTAARSSWEEVLQFQESHA